jgi:hypothetical protein
MAIVEAATIAARTVAQVVTRSNANTFRYLSQLPHLASDPNRPARTPGRPVGLPGPRYT